MTSPSYGRKNATILKYEWTKQRGSDKMKTPEEMRDFFRSMPAKKKDNPYWVFTAHKRMNENLSRFSNRWDFNPTILLMNSKNKSECSFFI